MDSKLLTVLIAATFVATGLMVVPDAYSYSAEERNLQVSVGVLIVPSIIPNGNTPEDKIAGNENVVAVLKEENGETWTGTAGNNSSATFKPAPNQESGVGYPNNNSGTFYPSAYIGRTSDTSNTPDICTTNGTYSVTFTVPAGLEFGLRLKMTATAIIGNYSGYTEISLNNEQLVRINGAADGVFIGSNGRMTDLTKDFEWIKAESDVEVTISGERNGRLVTNCEVQIFMKTNT